MIKVSTVQRQNLLTAKTMWKTVTEDRVAFNLGFWRSEADVSNILPDIPVPPTCNTIACFGGWCAWVPEFMKQGVYAAPDGSPHIGEIDLDKDVSFELFGVQGMFRWRNLGEDSCDDYKSDWRVVMDRINDALEGTIVQES